MQRSTPLPLGEVARAPHPCWTTCRASAWPPHPGAHRRRCQCRGPSGPKASLRGPSDRGTWPLPSSGPQSHARPPDTAEHPPFPGAILVTCTLNPSTKANSPPHSLVEGFPKNFKPFLPRGGVSRPTEQLGARARLSRCVQRPSAPVPHLRTAAPHHPSPGARTSAGIFISVAWATTRSKCHPNMWSERSASSPSVKPRCARVPFPGEPVSKQSTTSPRGQQRLLPRARTRVLHGHP